MNKRYQVFVSSTYEDLQDERREVIQALLELNCIPAGMELFPASDDDQWTLIKRVVDDCDYYIVIVGALYGSVGPDGLSYTEMEYRYALSAKKPIIAFLHKDPGLLPSNRTESDPKRRKKLDSFRELCQRKMCRFWDSPPTLGSAVSRSLINLINSRPAIGWVRGDLVLDEGSAAEILRLKKEVDRLTKAVADSRTVPPEGTELLAHGDDTFSIRCKIDVHDTAEGYISFSANMHPTWNEIFAVVAPLLIDEAKELDIRRQLDKFVAPLVRDAVADFQKHHDCRIREVSISHEDFQTIKIQLRALGLIAMSTRQRSLKNTSTYWALTPYGDTLMNTLRAIRRSTSGGRSKRHKAR